jgi:hypothetical protein
VSLAVAVDGEPFVIAADGGAITVTAGRGEDADARIAGSPHAVLALLSGGVSVEAAADTFGLRFEGDEAVLDRLVRR